MQIAFSDDALRDLEDHLHGNLEDRDPGVARNYGERFAKAFALIEEFPHIGRAGEVPGTREYTAVHPYIIIYQVDREDNDASDGGRLTVLNVWRGERDRSPRT